MTDAPVATGTITLDREKAKDKLRRFQLADPCAWLLELVRAAVAQGATWVDVQTDADDVRVSFDGRAFTADDVKELYEALLARGAPAGRQHLAVALNGALALGPRFVLLTSRDRHGAVSLRAAPDKPDVLDRDLDDSGLHQTTVWLRHAFRIGAFLEFFRARLGTQREITALRRGCRYAQLPITVNGDVITAPLPTQRGRAVTVRGAPGARVLVDAEEHPAHGVAVFTYRGVVLEEVPMPLLPRTIVAVLPSDHLTRDASLGAFVRDDAWHVLVDAALVTALTLSEDVEGVLLRDAAAALGPSVLGTGDAQQLERLPKLRAALAKPTRALCRQAVLTAVNGAQVTITDLLCVLRAGRPVLMSARRSTVPRRGDPIIHVDDGAARARLEHFVGLRHASGDDALDDAERRHHGHRRLLERTAALALFPGAILGVERWSSGGARGITGLDAAGNRLRLVLLTDGCMVGVHQLDCPLPGLSLAIEAPFTLTADCTDVERDGVFTRALRAAFARVPDALANACARANNADALARRALPLLAWALDPEALWTKLAAAAGCPMLDELAPLPPLVLDGGAVHPVCAVPCLPRVDASSASLDDVRGQTVPVVPADTVTFSRPEAIRSGEVLRAVLARVAHLQVCDEQAKREARRAQLLDGPATLRAPYPPAARFSIGDAAGGWIAFGGARAGIIVEAHIEGRPLPPVRFDDAPLGHLRVVVDDAVVLPLADGTLAAADARRYVRAGLAVAGALLETAAGAAGASSSGRKLAIALLTALAPTPALARAAELLDAEQYLALRALSLAADALDLTPLVELALEAGARPTVATIRDLAKAAGTKLPKRAANDGEARAFVLAPLGGLRGLREMDRRLSLPERVVQRLPALGALELRTLTGTVALRALVDRSAPLAFVPAGWRVPDGADPTEPVLVLTSDEEAALRALLGPSSLVDAVPVLRERAAMHAHRAKPVEDPRLEPGLHVGIAGFDHDGARGELGLVPPMGTQPSAHVRLLTGGRFVRRLDVSASAPCSFAAVIDDPALPVSLASAGANERAAQLAARCVALAERTLDQLVAALPQERPDARVRACLLERLARHDAHPIELERLGRLSQAPLADTIDGRWASFDRALAEVQQHGSVAVVANAPKGTPPRELVLVVAPTHHRELLARAGAPVEDVTAQWQAQTERQAALGRFPPMPAAPADAFAAGEAAVAGVHARLWVGPTTRGELISVGLERHCVAMVPLESVLPTVEGTVTGDPVVDPALGVVHLSLAWPAIDLAVAALATAMVAKVQELGVHDDVRQWCRRLAIRVAGAPDAHGGRLGPLLARVRALPLFECPDGAFLSLDQVLTTRPSGFERELAEAGLAPAPVVPEARPTPPRMQPTPEETLLARLAELLTLLALDDETQAQLACWPLTLVRRKGKALVRFTRVHCEIDLEHALGRAALDGDAAALDFLAAVVVGAANHHLDEIDERHERSFLARLLAHAATRAA